jgi:hypothetical protein
MIPEIGHFALILALSLALCQGVLPLLGAYRNNAALMAVARPTATGQFVSLAYFFHYGFIVTARRDGGVQSDALQHAYYSPLRDSTLVFPERYKQGNCRGHHEYGGDDLIQQ